ncbi:unnamed protein product [Blepharisma stoltei]|uniref:Uncharacterized protein n=1 Tax=Blepharisma stoltei TaxID=1481888 RepID=A0AAU9IHD7_9CILI|nr:unnamed protein product [Blepharisma stoltei]
MAELGDNSSLLRSKIQKIKYQSAFYVLSFLVPNLLIIFASYEIRAIGFAVVTMLPYLILGLFGYFSIRTGNSFLFAIYGILAIVLSVLNVVLVIFSIISLAWASFEYGSICPNRHDEDCNFSRGIVMLLMILNILTIVIGTLFAILLAFSAKYGIQCRRLIDESPVAQGYVSYV